MKNFAEKTLQYTHSVTWNNIYIYTDWKWNSFVFAKLFLRNDVHRGNSYTNNNDSTVMSMINIWSNDRSMKYATYEKFK